MSQKNIIVSKSTVESQESIHISASIEARAKHVAKNIFKKYEKISVTTNIKKLVDSTINTSIGQKNKQSIYRISFFSGALNRSE